ncbi:PPE family protein [Mycobacterium sp. UM_CSW]|uniref:PPE family protein n=1 Tax=Mycobacterium sp. UM_CSW TaxID=1370119 RepID=UPI000422E362|nr:PPE family protein [Mycobacterium sp. UM_CSW]
MDFGALPPEVNSGRMYEGPGPETLLAASVGWESLAAELVDAAGGYRSVIAGLTAESWLGRTSMSMAAALAPYLSWMTATAAECTTAATQATVAATAFEAAHAMTVPPPLIAANRTQLIGLIATNFFGQSTPAIMATEAEYGEMWAKDAAAMYHYAANSAAASALSLFTSPPRVTHPGRLAASHAHTETAKLISSVPKTLQMLATPGLSPVAAGIAATGPSTGAGLGQAASLGALSVPPGWADAVSEVTAPPALDANVMPGGWGAGPSVRRGSAASVRRVIVRAKSIPRSPVAG